MTYDIMKEVETLLSLIKGQSLALVYEYKNIK